MKTMKTIELGGGDNPTFRPNYDIRHLQNVDVVIDLNNSLPIPDNEYDLVYSKYLIEHISWHNVKNFLKEIYRILKPEGKIEIVTSNLLEQAKVLTNTKEWNDDLIGMVFGGQDFNENTHRCGFSPQSITNVLTSFGFDNIEITPINSNFGPTDMIIKAVKHGTISDKNSNFLKIITGVDRQNWVVRHCELGEKILDIGSQDGHTFRDTPLAQFVTSVDLDTYDFPGFIQMNAHNLKFEDKSFDVAILGEILEHCDNPVQVLKEANRVSKRLLITVPDEWNWDKSLFPFETIEDGMKRRNLSLEEIVRVSNPQAKEFYVEDNHKHLFHNRYYTQQTLTQDLENAGITDYEMTRLQYGIPLWSFFVVETNTKDVIKDKITDTAINRDTSIKTIPIITTGPIIKDNIQGNIRKDKLRIALISTPFFTVPPKGYSGLEMVIWDLARSLDELGHDVTIFGPEGSQTTKHGHLITIGPSISTVNVDWFQAEKNAYEKYKYLITPDKYDVIHDHSWFSFIYLSKIKNPDLKIIHSHHGGFNWESIPPVPKPNLVSISNYMKLYTEQYFQQRGYNVHSEYVRNGIDLDKYPFHPNKSDNLLFVGRLSTFKQPHAVIEVARKTKHKLDIVGGTFVDSEDYVKQLDKMVENDPNIKIYKDVTHEFKIEKMQNAKAVIIPSKMNEPLNLVSLESQACGTPVIVTRDGGLPETVIHGKTGFVCNTMEQMIEAINQIHLIKPDDCRKHVEDNFSRLKMTEDYVKLYNRILNNDEW